MERTTIILLIAAAAAHAQGSVEGWVINSVGGSGVKRAVVTLKGEETYLVRTDAEGRFALKDVVPGKYEVEAARDGYQAKPQRSVALNAGPNAALLLQLVPLATIAGKIVDENGEPVPEASVEAMRYRFTGANKQLRSNGKAVTNDRGEYLLADLAPSRYYLRANNTNQDPPIYGDMEDRGPRRLQVYAPAFYPGTRDPGRASMLDAEAGAELRNVDLQMHHEGVYSIIGTTSPGLAVKLIRLMNEPGGSYATRMGSSGPFEIWGLTPGPYVVTAVRQDAVYSERKVEILGDDVRGVDLTHATSVTVAGRVENAPAGAHVVFQRDDGTPLNVNAQVEADGSFQVNAQPEGYVVHLQGGGAYLKSMRIGNREVADHRLLPGSSDGELALTASTGAGRIEGAVTDADGQPAIGVNVTLVPDQRLPYWGDMALTAVTNGSGAFTMQRVIPGEYRLFAVASAEVGAALDAEFRRPIEERGTALRVEADGTASVKLTLIQ
jgi:hypothetical protein